jgi:HK97 family phage major capsid protein
MSATLFRDALLDGLETETGTARLSFASEHPVFRFDKKHGRYWEVLSHAPGDANLGLLNSQGIVLRDHDESDVIGDVEKNSARVDADRKTRCKIRVSDSAMKSRIAAGNYPPVSVGYTQLSVVRREEGDYGVPILYFSWQPYEVSLLTGEPADPTVGVNRSLSMQNTLEQILAAAISGARSHESENRFTRKALVEDYSLREHILARAEKRELVGFARDVSDSVKFIGGDVLSGHFVPFASLLPRQRSMRDMQATIFNSGGAFVQADLHPAIELLRNHVVAIPLGAQVVTGLQGNAFFPRVTADVTDQSLSEIAQGNLSTPELDQLAFGPMRTYVGVNISRQLLVQTGNGAEDLVRRQITQAIGVKLDRLILKGQGANSEPTGIMNTAGVGAVTFGGAATWANVLAFENNLAGQNADIGALGWAISTGTRNKWKQASRISATNYPSFLMEGGMVNDYPALATTQLGDDDQAVFGRWDDLYVLIWSDGFDFLVDPYTSAAAGKVTVHCNFWFNVLLQHPQSFCVSTDSGAQ